MGKIVQNFIFRHFTHRYFEGTLLERCLPLTFLSPALEDLDELVRDVADVLPGPVGPEDEAQQLQLSQALPSHTVQL